MTSVVRDIIPNYDIHERTGFPSSIAIPSRDVARQIVNDVMQERRLLQLIGSLIDIHELGVMGRRNPIPHIQLIVQEVMENGYLFDQKNRMFVENPAVRKTRNWGALLPGKEYIFAFLRIDIVKNSLLVRNHTAITIRKAYGALRDIVLASVEKRNGRLWKWEGDGGLAAFFFEDKHQRATLSAMEIIHELFLYNRIACPLPSPLAARIAVHSGPVDYSDNDETLKQNPTLSRLMEVEERLTRPQSITISSVVRVMLDAILSNEFEPLSDDSQGTYFNYSLKWES
jgi:class 3 adenylate cyclase